MIPSMQYYMTVLSLYAHELLWQKSFTVYFTSCKEKLTLETKANNYQHGNGPRSQVKY